jgi:hypothetical protein
MEKIMPTERERERERERDFIFQKMRCCLLVDDRFCHPDACKAQIPLDNVPSRHIEKFERERERFCFSKMPCSLLADDRFCHPVACGAQILPSRCMQSTDSAL